MEVNVPQGQSRFSELIEKAHTGEVITITKNGVPWADIYPHTQKRRLIRPMNQAPFSLPEGVSICDPHDEEDLTSWQ